MRSRQSALRPTRCDRYGWAPRWQRRRRPGTPAIQGAAEATARERLGRTPVAGHRGRAAASCHCPVPESLRGRRGRSAGVRSDFSEALLCPPTRRSKTRVSVVDPLEAVLGRPDPPAIHSGDTNSSCASFKPKKFICALSYASSRSLAYSPWPRPDATARWCLSYGPPQSSRRQRCVHAPAVGVPLLFRPSRALTRACLPRSALAPCRECGWCGGGVCLVSLSLSSLASPPTAYLPIGSAVFVHLALACACARLLPRLDPNAHTRRHAPRAPACTRLRHVPLSARCAGAPSCARAPT